MRRLLSEKLLYRKYIHMLASTPFLILALFVDTYLTRMSYIVVALGILLFFALIETIRLYHGSLNEYLHKRFPFFFKPHERRTMGAAIWWPVNLLILVSFFSKPTIICSFLIANYADPIAAIVGTLWGKKKNGNGKTLEGAVAFFIVSTILLLGAGAIFAIPLHPLILIGLALLGAVVEYANRLFDDNLVVPILFAVAMELSLFLFVTLR